MRIPRSVATQGAVGNRLQAVGRAAATVAVAAVSMFGVVSALAATPAGAPVYPPSGCSLALSASVAVPGETVVASTENCDSGYAAGAEVVLTLESANPMRLTTAMPDGKGQFSTPFTIPNEATPGRHNVVARGEGADGSTLTLSAGLTLSSGAADARAPEREGGLAFTGSDALPLVWIALALLTIGTALVLAVRRRAQTRRTLST